VQRIPPLRLLLKTVQCFFAKPVRVSLTCFGEFDDLVGDDFVSNRIVIILTPLYPNAARTNSYATGITRMASGSNGWDEPRRNFLNGIGALVKLVQRIEWSEPLCFPQAVRRAGLRLRMSHAGGRVLWC